MRKRSAFPSNFLKPFSQTASLWKYALACLSLTTVVGHPSAARAQFACDATLYISQAAGALDPTQLNRIDTSGSSFNIVSTDENGNPLPGGTVGYNGLGYRVQDGFLYGIEPEQGIAAPADQFTIYQIGPTGATAVTSIDPVTSGTHRFRSGDVDPSGFYYAYSDDTGLLVRVDLTTGQIVNEITIPDIGGNPPDFFDLVFPVNGVVSATQVFFFTYEADTNEIVRVDLNLASNTATVTQTGTSPGLNAVGATYFLPNGNLLLYQNAPGQLYSAQGSASSSLTLLSNVSGGLGQNDGAGCPAAPVFQKVATPPSIAQGGTITYTYTITNPNFTFAYSNAVFTDTMPNTDGRVFNGTVRAYQLINPGGAANNPPIGGTTSFSNGNKTFQLNGFAVPPNSTVIIEAEVTVPASTPPTTAGNPLLNQAEFEADTPFPNVRVRQRSDYPVTTTGTFPDPTPTEVTPSTSGLLGVAKRVDSVTSSGANQIDVTYEIVAENFGAEDLSNFQLVEDLNTTFGAGSFSIQNLTTTSAISVNFPGFDGNGLGGNTNLIAASQVLPANSTATFRLTVRVDTSSATLPRPVPGPYENQVDGSGELPGGQRVTDSSTDGFNPDPDGDNDPTEPGENAPTTVRFGPDLRVVKRIVAANRPGSGAIPVAGINSFNNDPVDPDDDVLNAQGLSPVGVVNIDSETLQSGDEITYAIYFLNVGIGPANSIEICDAISPNTTLVVNSVGVSLTSGSPFGGNIDLKDPLEVLNDSCIGAPGTFPGGGGTVGTVPGGGIVIDSFDLDASQGGTLTFAIRVP
ncbi:DUF6923 family protein [Sphaerothrix gracilis]|uniref:DUF6923 family protein n=1 Tax=Sphaerothrix gracilis TaxID=3151835 RepID=UPI0031FD53EF